ncbi:MAG TPA: hypothetical protein DCX07_02855 [Phycisphaerales bacterium]|nr:hypothetical protein [Phycisphaerales bacterium]
MTPPVRPESSDFARLSEEGSTRVCVLGGQRLCRAAMAAQLERLGFEVNHSLTDEMELDRCGCLDSPSSCRVLLLIASAQGPFATLHRVREILARTAKDVALVVLAEHATRGHLLAAIRAGAKAVLDYDCEPDELAVAIRRAAGGQTHLAGDAAEMLLNGVADGTPVVSGSANLSDRERETLHLLCKGLTTKEIARHLHLSVKTAENHRYAVYRKCKAGNLAELIRHAIRQGLVPV